MYLWLETRRNLTLCSWWRSRRASAPATSLASSSALIRAFISVTQLVRSRKSAVKRCSLQGRESLWLSVKRAMTVYGTKPSPTTWDIVIKASSGCSIPAIPDLFHFAAHLHSSTIFAAPQHIRSCAHHIYLSTPQEPNSSLSQPTCITLTDH